MTKACVNIPIIGQHQDFTVYTLANDEVQLVIAPELGAKIISLKNLRTGREWLWHPGGDMRLFRNQTGDDFSASPLAGIDECLPTIAPCTWRGRNLPDHGEVWSQPWQVEECVPGNSTLTTSIKLKTSPLLFRRTVCLQGNEVWLDYELSNLSGGDENFIWAIHPLLRLAPGDELELPFSTRELLNGETWLDAITSAVPEKKLAKVFAAPISEGWVAIKNDRQGDRFKLAWDPAGLNALGVWLTCGGWHGHHHIALEPTNADNDSLLLAARGKHCGIIAANSSMAWQLSIQVGL
jgi:hypothetical protein